MSQRTSLLIVGSAIGCSMLLLCIFVTAISIVPAIATINNPPINRVDRIAYIDNDQNIQLVDARGEHRLALTTDGLSTGRAYAYPTWSPDSQRVAFVALANRTQREGGLFIAPIAGGDRATVFQSASQFPFYLYWSPDSRHIGFLTQDAAGLSLMLGQVDGLTPARKLEAGSPFYWAWSPDSQSMFLHTGGNRRNARLALLRLSDYKLQTLSRSPGEFQAPHFSPDGKMMLYAATTDTGDNAIYLADADDNNTRTIVNYRGQVAFAWSPDGKKMAWLPTSANSRLVNEGPIIVSDARGENRHKIVDEDVLAFFWSPDSTQIAYVTLVLPGENQGCVSDCGRVTGMAQPSTQDISIRLRWRLVNLADGQTRTLVTFTPTAGFVSVLPYFDQYARSITFWSPDSQRFVYTQDEGEDNGSVWVANVAGEQNSRRVGDGTLAVWSWR